MIMVALRGRVSENFPSETVWKIARGLLGCGHRWCTVSINSASWPLATDLQRPRLCISEFPDSLRREILGNPEAQENIRLVEYLSSALSLSRYKCNTVRWARGVLKLKATPTKKQT